MNCVSLTGHSCMIDATAGAGGPTLGMSTIDRMEDRALPPRKRRRLLSPEVHARTISPTNAERLGAMRWFLSDVHMISDGDIHEWSNDVRHERYLYRLAMDFFVHRLGYGRRIILGNDPYATRPLLTCVSQQGVEAGGPLTKHWPCPDTRPAGCTNASRTLDASVSILLKHDLLPPPGHEYVYVGLANHLALDFDFINFCIVAYSSDMKRHRMDLQPPSSTHFSMPTMSPIDVHSYSGVFSDESDTEQDAVDTSPGRPGCDTSLPMGIHGTFPPEEVVTSIIVRTVKARFSDKVGRMHNLASLVASMRYVDKLLRDIELRPNSGGLDVRPAVEADLLRNTEWLISDSFLRCAVPVPGLTRRERLLRLLRAREADFHCAVDAKPSKLYRLVFNTLVARECVGMGHIASRRSRTGQREICPRQFRHTYAKSWFPSEDDTIVLGTPFIRSSEPVGPCGMNSEAVVVIKNNETDALDDARTSAVIRITMNHKDTGDTLVKMLENTIDIACPDHKRGCASSTRAAFPERYRVTRPKRDSGRLTTAHSISRRYKDLLFKTDQLIKGDM